jgi:acetoin utilization deacetylase AcuC-like enzyme
MLTNAIEVGKRLKEAKALLPHGEWGKWLVESVSYSQRTANRLMQLSEKYGEKLFAFTAEGGSSNSSALTNLTYYQALLLLEIPEDERENRISNRQKNRQTKKQFKNCSLPSNYHGV